ncbi:MAG: hypothetical protein JO022_07480 [Acidobacteriaceae bacterium]|nr:hypothetical protein [Acidobacteriaceae bacterium]
MSHREVCRFDGPCKVLFVGTRPNTRRDLLPLLTRHIPLASPIDVPALAGRDELRPILQGPDPAFCFVDIDHSGKQLLELIPEYLEIAPKLSLVAILPPNEPDLILKSLRRGAADFLIPPFSVDQVEAVLRKLLRQFPTTSAARGSVYAVIPVKGASGASTIATALAFAFKAGTDKKVLLADLDPLTGIIAFLLKVKPQFTFADVLHRASDMDDDLWKAMITVRDGVDILVAPEMPTANADLVDPLPIIEYARFHYSAVVADLGTPYGDWSLAVASASDDVLLVTTNEIFSVHAAQRVLGYLESKGIPRQKMRVLVNRFERDIGLREAVMRDALGMEITEFLPSDYAALQQALLDDKLVSPSSRFGRAISVLADRLEGPPLTSRKGASFTGLLSLFSRLST